MSDVTIVQYFIFTYFLSYKILSFFYLFLHILLFKAVESSAFWLSWDQIVYFQKKNNKSKPEIVTMNIKKPIWGDCALY